MSDKPLNIYQRLREVMKLVAYIKKDATVSGGGSYKAVTHDMVTAVVRPHFVAQGIIVVPRLVKGEVVDTGRKTSSGNPIIRYEGLYEVSFVNVDDPTDVCMIPVSAHAEDQGDKAPGKALSYATKYGILKALLLESGENDESRVQPLEDEPQPLSEDEIEGLKEKLNKAKNKSELRAALKDAFAVAQKANDMDAHAALKAYAGTLAQNLPDEVPA
jgi:hypothetical protein